MKFSALIASILVSLFLAYPHQSIAAQKPVCSCDCQEGNCDLEKFKSDKSIAGVLEIAADPTGLAISSQDKDQKVDEVLKSYVKKHDCSIYYMSMQELTQGLLKGFKLDESMTQSQNTPQHETTHVTQKQKYILISPDKYDCIKKLGFKLPVKAITPNAK